MTDDVIHSNQHYIKYINRAIFANLQHSPLKLRLNWKHTHGYKKLCSHGNSFYSSPHPLDFNMSVIFSSKNSKCVVPENIHTPTVEGIGNSEVRRGGGQRPRKFQRGVGLYDRVSFQRDSRGPLIEYGFESRSSCSKILSYLLSRTFR